MILARQRAEVGGLGDVEAAGAVLGRQAERSCRRGRPAGGPRPFAGSWRQPSPSGSNRLIEITWSTMPGSSRPALPPSICGCQCSRLNSSTTRSRMPTKITVLPGRMLEVLEQRDHLAGEQPVGTAGIRLAGLVAESLRPRLRPGHRLAGQVGDAVDEDDPLAGDHAARSG